MNEERKGADVSVTSLTAAGRFVASGYEDMKRVAKLRPPPHSNMTSEMALESAKDVEPTDVLIIGYDKDGDLFVLSSHMTRKDALWLAEKAREHALGED